MAKFLSRIVTAIIPLVCVEAQAVVKPNNLFINNISPFIGIDVGRSRLDLQRNFGGKIFRKNATTYNFFAGLDFNEYFGVEFGYQRDNARREPNAKLITGDVRPGTTAPIIPVNSPVVLNTLINFKQNYIGIIARRLFFKDISISLFAGIARIKINAVETEISAGSITFENLVKERIITAEQLQGLALRRTYRKSKSVPVLRMGVNYRINSIFSLRANTTWIKSAMSINSEQNGQFSDILGDTVPNHTIKAKNSLRYSLGIVISPFNN